jgi:hypothetical protein
MKKLIVAAVLLGSLIVAGSASAATFTCTPVDVLVATNRIHIKCSTAVLDGSSSIRWFAVSATADVPFANRFLTIGTTALVAGRNVMFTWTAGDTSGTAFGCAAADCRKAAAVNLF